MHRTTAAAGDRARPSLRTIPVILALMFLGVVPALAAPGISGKVYSTETGQPLGFANVTASRMDREGSTLGTIAAGDGSYRIDCEPGTYVVRGHFIAFSPLEIEGVVVKPGAPTTIDVGLTPDTIELEEFRVTAEVAQKTSSALLTEQRNSAVVQDGIGQREIKRSADSDAAEVANRVTGVSVVGDKFVYVRGLGERYSSIQLDGTGVSSPEPNRRVLPLDLFPAGLLDNLVVQKTYTPDQSGEFGGGVVNVNTLNFPNGRSWNLGVSTGDKHGTTGSAFRTYAGGKRDHLGFDDGTRGIPSAINELAAHKPLVRGGLFDPDGLSADEIEAAGESFNRTWETRGEEAAPPYSVSASFGDTWDVMGRDFGFVASGSIKNSYSAYDRFEKRDFKGLEQDGSLAINDDLKVDRYDASRLLGGLFNGGLRVTDSHTLNFRALYTRSADDQVLLQEGQTEELPIRETRLLYTERGLFSGQLGMEHKLPLLSDSEIDWSFSYSQAERNQPDRRGYTYEQFNRVDAWGETYQRWELSRRDTQKSFSRSYEFSDDYERNWKADWTVPFRQWSGLEARVKVGYASTNKDRYNYLRRFAYEAPSPRFGQSTVADSLFLSPSELLTDDHIGGTRTGAFAIKEATTATDGHVARFDNEAWYGMVDWPIVRRVRVVAGARVEDWKQEVNTGNEFFDAFRETAVLEKRDVLPSVNLKVAMGERTNLRLGYSQTLNRPDLRELSPQAFIDTDRDRKFVGNPELKRALIDAWDLRAEWYPGPGELMAASVFRKDMTDPIEYQVYQETGAGRLQYQPINAESAYIRGVEFEVRLGLGRIAERVQDFGLTTNVTLIESEATLPKTEYANSDAHPLAGQSDYVVNLGAFYQSPDGKLDLGLLYNVFGKRLDVVQLPTEDDTREVPDVFEQPFHSLDFTATRRFFNGAIKIKGSAENLMDSEIEYKQGNEITERRRPGRAFALALSYGG